MANRRLQHSIAINPKIAAKPPVQSFIDDPVLAIDEELHKQSVARDAAAKERSRFDELPFVGETVSDEGAGEGKEAGSPHGHAEGPDPMGARGTAHGARQAGRSSIDDYDPKQAQEAEREAMYKEIMNLREQVSKARLGVMR